MLIKQHLLTDQNIFAISKTWSLDVKTCYADNQFSFQNYQFNFCNAGNDKGLAAYNEYAFNL